MVRFLFIASLGIVLLSGSHSWGTGGEIASKQPALQVLHPVVEVLNKAKVSGSLELWGRCDLGSFPGLPKLRVPATSGSAANTLREIFENDPRMQVTQEPDGTVRMIEAGIPTDLLDVRISHISFPDFYAYSPSNALHLILQAPEVVAFERSHDIQWAFAAEPPQGLHTAQSTKLPHLTGSLHNVTLSQALDYVLRTFPGLWVYENCLGTKASTVYFQFYQSYPTLPASAIP